MIDIQAGQDYRQRCQENLDPLNLNRIERDEAEMRRDNGSDFNRRTLAHSPGPTQQMQSTAELLELWGEVAMAIAAAKDGLLELADGKFAVSARHRDCLRLAAEALAPFVSQAMAIRQSLSETYREQFNQNQRASA